VEPRIKGPRSGAVEGPSAWYGQPAARKPPDLKRSRQAEGTSEESSSRRAKARPVDRRRLAASRTTSAKGVRCRRAEGSVR
jgi:hypothetical protein